MDPSEGENYPRPLDLHHGAAVTAVSGPSSAVLASSQYLPLASTFVQNAETERPPDVSIKLTTVEVTVQSAAPAVLLPSINQTVIQSLNHSLTDSVSSSVSNPAATVRPQVQLVAGKFEVIRVTSPLEPPALLKPVLPTETPKTEAEVTPVKKDGKKDVDEDEESDDDKDNKHKVVETSPCGRYHKRRERVLQREVPGIDAAFLAMDSEEGKEVVWNEVQFSEKKNYKEKEEQIHQIFDNLINLHHPSILKFHRWWTDAEQNPEKPRVIFITEHISSGSLNHFIKTSKHSSSSANGSTCMPQKSWKRWSRQILTALNYLHSAKPPIVHGNLNLDTVFLQHNGLTKIGCVAPDAIHQHVRTCREHINVRNMHFVAPEYAFETILTPAADIYSFGILTLEMLIYGINSAIAKEKEKEKEKESASSANLLMLPGAVSAAPPNVGATLTSSESLPVMPVASLYPISLETVNIALESLEDPTIKQMIRDCLHHIPEMRPSAKNLLFHKAFFEVPPLKQIAAFAFVDYFSADHLDNWNDLAVSYGKDTTSDSVIAENPRTKQVFRVSQLQNPDLDKYLEDIRQGVHPLTAFGVDSPTTSLLTTPAQSTRDEGESYGLGDEFEEDFINEVETRLIMSCMCTIRTKHDSPVAALELILRMEDKMNRHLMCDFDEDNDSADTLAEELLDYGLINDQDQDKLLRLIETTLITSTGRKNESVMMMQQQHQLVNSTNANDEVENGFRNPLIANSSVDGWDVVVRSAVMTFNTSSNIVPAVQPLIDLAGQKAGDSLSIHNFLSSTVNGNAPVMPPS